MATIKQKYKALTREKIDFIYKIIDILIKSVPSPIQEDVRTRLLFLAMDIAGWQKGYIFVALRNKKINILRHSELVNSADNNSLRLIDIGHEKNNSHNALEIMENLNILYIAYKRSTRIEKNYIREVVRLFLKKGETNNTIVSRKMKFNRKRGFHVLSSIRDKIKEIKNEKRPKLLQNLRNVEDLQRKIQYTTPG